MFFSEAEIMFTSSFVYDGNETTQKNTNVSRIHSVSVFLPHKSRLFVNDSLFWITAAAKLSSMTACFPFIWRTHGRKTYNKQQK